MIDKEFIENLLKTDQPFGKNPKRFSTIITALKSARFLCSNGLLCDKYRKDEIIDFIFEKGLYHSNAQAGILLYLIFLDQVGIIFKPKNEKEIKASKNRGSEISRALKHFSSLNDSEISIIRNLRNSLSHNFGLATTSHKFTLSTEKSSAIIKNEKKWTGDFNDKREETQTTIYVQNLIELVESIYENLLEENKNNNLEIVIDKDELLAKFTIIN